MAEIDTAERFTGLLDQHLPQWRMLREERNGTVLAESLRGMRPQAIKSPMPAACSNTDWEKNGEEH